MNRNCYHILLNNTYKTAQQYIQNYSTIHTKLLNNTPNNNAPDKNEPLHNIYYCTYDIPFKSISSTDVILKNERLFIQNIEGSIRGK